MGEGKLKLGLPFQIAHFDAQAQKLALWQSIVSPGSHLANDQLANFLGRFASELSILCRISSLFLNCNVKL